MNEERLLKVLIAPLVSEKSTMLAQNKQVVLKVLPDANAKEIKAAVEKIFEVSVLSVRTINVKGKRKRFGKMQGRRKNWKKAYITMRSDDTFALDDINVMQQSG